MSSALADTTTLTLSNTIQGTTSSPQSMLFPLTRTGDLGYDVSLSYHTIDGTAVSPIDYVGTSYDSFVFPAGVTGGVVGLTLNANTGAGSAQTFQVQLDSVVGVGPPPGFPQAQTFAVGTSPSSVVAMDVNGDGKLDLVVGNKGANVLSFLLNNTAAGSASASFAAEQQISTPFQSSYLATADINGDGKPDLISAIYGASAVEVSLNTTTPGSGSVTFASQQVSTGQPSPNGVATADINGDGKPDLIVANSSLSAVSVLLNATAPGAGTASFMPVQAFATGIYPLSVAVVDLNGDGKADVITSNSDNTISLLLNTTTAGATSASFMAYQSLSLAGMTLGSITTADVDGDGRPDLVVADDGDNTVLVLLNTTVAGVTTLSFASPQAFNVGLNPIAVTTADVNGDGKPDLLVANTGDATISVLRNLTAPGSTVVNFEGQQTFSVGNNPRVIAAGDLNGDGITDIAVSNYDDNSVSVLLNGNTAPAAVAPSFAPQQTFGTGANPYAIASADFNGDGKPDVVVANSGNSLGNTISVLLDTSAPGATSPSFSQQQPFTVGAAGADPIAVATADLNGDGKNDIIVVIEGGYAVAALLNTTAPGALTPSFGPVQTFVSGTLPTAVAVGDINNDGKPDLVVTISGTSGTGHDVWTYLNTTGTGSNTLSFSPQVFTVGTNPQSVTLADVNGDGKKDVIVANGNDGTISVLLNSTAPGAPTATFSPQQTVTTGSYTYFVNTADLNGDGRPDLIVIRYDGSNLVTVLLNSTAPGAPTASFAPQQTFATDSGPEVAVAADVDGDGRLDLIVADWNNSPLSVLLNATLPGAMTPSFANEQPFATGTATFSVASADVNGDGRPDLIAANFGDNTISVLLNTQYQATLAGSPATGTILHPAKLVFTQQPAASYASNGTITVKVSVEDPAGTLVSTDTSPITLALQGGTGGAALGGTTIVNAVGGVATFNVAVNLVGSGYALHATDGSLVGADSSAFNITPGAAAKLVFTSQPPASTASNAAFAATVKIEDAAGNVVTGNTSTVTLTLTGGTAGAVLTGGSVAAVAGVATFPNLKVDKAGAGYKLHSTDGSLTAADSSAFGITPGAAAKLVFTAQPPATSISSTAFSATVKIEDAAGNVVTGNTSTVTLALTGGTAGALLTGGSVAAVAGVATFPNLKVDKVGTSYKLHATDGSLTAADSSAFSITPGAAATLVFTTQPPASSISSTAFSATVKIEDAAGNVVTGNTSTVNLALTGGTAGAVLTGGSVAAVAGVATFPNLKVDKVGTSYQLHATDGTLAAADSSAFNITPGAAAKLAFTTQPPASSVSSTAFAATVKIEDAASNVVTGNTSTVTLTLTGGTVGAVLTGGSIAAVAGVATFSNLKVDKVGTGYTLHATDGSLTATDSSAFNIIVGAASVISYTVQPSSAVTGASIAPAIVVHVQDAGGNPVSADGITLSILNNPGSATLNGGGSTLTNASGNSTFSAVSLNKAGTSYTLKASDSSGTPLTVTSSAFNINKASTATILTTVKTNPSVVGQNYTASGSVTVVAPGGGIPAGTVTVSDGAVTSPPCTLNGSGAYICTLASTSTGSKTLTATYAGNANYLTSSATHAQTISKASTTTMLTTVTSNPSVVGQNYTASGSVAVVAPGGGIPAGTVTVSDGTVTSPSCTLNGSGAYTCTLASTTAGNKTLTATYAGNANYLASSATHTQTINKAATTLSITAHSPNPSYPGQAVAVTVSLSVTAPGVGTPSGAVTVSDGSSSCSIALPATGCNITFSTVGTRTLTATYPGDNGFAASTSAGVSQTVQTVTGLDLSIAVSDGHVYRRQGDSVSYTIVATSIGTLGATGATLKDTFPAQLSGVTWTCSAGGGGACGAASGSGNINTTVNLPVGGSAIFFVSATVAPNDGTIVDTATITAPAGKTDNNLTNNSATDKDYIVIFHDGFEGASGL